MRPKRMSSARKARPSARACSMPAGERLRWPARSPSRPVSTCSWTVVECRRNTTLPPSRMAATSCAGVACARAGAESSATPSVPNRNASPGEGRQAQLPLPVSRSSPLASRSPIDCSNCSADDDPMGALDSAIMRRWSHIYIDDRSCRPLVSLDVELAAGNARIVVELVLEQDLSALAQLLGGVLDQRIVGRGPVRHMDHRHEIVGGVVLDIELFRRNGFSAMRGEGDIPRLSVRSERSPRNDARDWNRAASSWAKAAPRSPGQGHTRNHSGNTQRNEPGHDDPP